MKKAVLFLRKNALYIAVLALLSSAGLFMFFGGTDATFEITHVVVEDDGTILANTKDAVLKRPGALSSGRDEFVKGKCYQVRYWTPLCDQGSVRLEGFTGKPVLNINKNYGEVQCPGTTRQPSPSPAKT